MGKFLIEILGKKHQQLQSFNDLVYLGKRRPIRRRSRLDFFSALSTADSTLIFHWCSYSYVLPLTPASDGGLWTPFVALFISWKHGCFFQDGPLMVFVLSILLFWSCCWYIDQIKIKIRIEYRYICYTTSLNCRW